jgi:hypothetical protein
MPTTLAHLDRIDALLSDPPTKRTKAGRHAHALAVVRVESLDETVRAFSCFKSFGELIEDSTRTGYTPTLRTRPDDSSLPALLRAERAKRIADAFDWHMITHRVVSPRGGHPLRAWRGSASCSARSLEPSRIMATTCTVHPSITLLGKVRQEVRSIRVLAKRDPDATHSREDKLRAEVLTYIASGQATKNDAIALAQAVLKTAEIEFARWTA